MDHKTYMELAIALARRGGSLVAPNPMVGAVVVKNGQIIGQGYHRRYGGEHAETDALSRCSQDPAGATLYCNLEPCCFHHPKKHQPPCTEKIIASKISRVVLANLDPNPMVNGQGVRILREHGIEVIQGICQEEGSHLNRLFFEMVREKAPFQKEEVACSLES